MKAVTETFLRSLFRNHSAKQFTLAEGQILTPSARAFLTDRHVEILLSGAESERKEKTLPQVRENSPETVPESAERPRYVSARDGGEFSAKPEFMTHLKGNHLVTKDHGRIIFRGKLDSFESSVLLLQSKAFEKGKDKMVQDLEDILDWARQIMKAEVLEIPLEKSTVLGLTPDQMRQYSHNPKKAFGVEHILPSADMGEWLLGLNALRSQSREVEIAGVTAFHREFEIQRQDILTALNRMSSVIYIMMAKERAGVYSGHLSGK